LVLGYRPWWERSARIRSTPPRAPRPTVGPPPYVGGGRARSGRIAAFQPAGAIRYRYIGLFVDPPMSPKRVKTTRKPRGAQKWVLAELRALPAGAQLATAKIASRIAKASGKTFHKNSVYNALRALVNRGEISVVRKGVQKLYQVRTSLRPSARRSAAPSTPSIPAGATESAPQLPAPAPTSSVAALPHKLAVGEALVLDVSDNSVLTATNLHGRIVLERHPIPG